MTMHRIDRRQFLRYGLAAASATALPTAALAYPDRPIRLIVPFSPGGATDVAARLWAEKMKPTLGTVVTENKGGGGGVIGATEVARSKPDGHTFVFGNTSTQVLIPAIADESDIDDLAAAVGRVLMALDRVREPATA
jgi:tripartite-type tricarboxylate transporter receptor subunit TctC